MNFQLRAQAAPWSRGVELLIFCGNKSAVFSGLEEPVWDGNGYRHNADGTTETQPLKGSSLQFVDHEPGTPREPSLDISIEAAQTLMDDLWQAGLRPTEGTGSAGSLAATERHLKDMQRLVFDHFVKGLP